MDLRKFDDPLAETVQNTRIEHARTYHEHTAQRQGGRMVKARKTFFGAKDAGHYEQGHNDNGCGVYGKVVLYKEYDTNTDNDNGDDQIAAHRVHYITVPFLNDPFVFSLGKGNPGQLFGEFGLSIGNTLSCFRRLVLFGHLKLLAQIDQFVPLFYICKIQAV